MFYRPIKQHLHLNKFWSWNSHSTNANFDELRHITIFDQYRAMLRSANYGELPEREESATVHAASTRHHLSATIYRDTSETMTLVVNNSLVIWRHFCLHGPICQRRLWEHLLKKCFINGLTYLLYLLTQVAAWWQVMTGCKKVASGFYTQCPVCVSQSNLPVAQQYFEATKFSCDGSSIGTLLTVK